MHGCCPQVASLQMFEVLINAAANQALLYAAMLALMTAQTLEKV